MIAHATILLLPQTRHVRMHIKNPLLEKEIRGKSQRPGSKKGPTQIFNEGCVLFWLTCPSYIPKSVAMSKEKHHSSNCKQKPLGCNSIVYRFHYWFCLVLIWLLYLYWKWMTIRIWKDPCQSTGVQPKTLSSVKQVLILHYNWAICWREKDTNNAITFSKPCNCRSLLFAHQTDIKRIFKLTFFATVWQYANLD